MEGSKDNKIKSFLKRYAISIAILVILVSYISKNVTVEELINVISSVDIKLIIIIGFSTYLGTIARTLRWVLFTRQLGIKLPFKEILKMVFFSGYLNLILPGRAGDIFSVFYFKKHNIPASRSLGGMFLERISDLLFVLVGAIIFIPFGIALINDTRFKDYATFASVGGVIFAVALILLFFLLIKKKSLLKKIPFIKKFDTDRIVDNVKEGVKIIAKDKKAFLKYVLFTVIRWLPEFFMYYLVFFAFNINLNIILLILFTFFVALVYSIPLFPGALGLFEGFVILFFKSLGRTEAEAAIFILVVRMITVLFYIIPLSVLTHKIGKEITNILEKQKNEI